MNNIIDTKEEIKTVTKKKNGNTYTIKIPKDVLNKEDNKIDVCINSNIFSINRFLAKLAVLSIGLIFINFVLSRFFW